MSCDGAVTSLLATLQPITIPKLATWASNGVTVAGCGTAGDDLEKLNRCTSLCIDDDGSILIADHYNHRIVEWKPGDTRGHLVAGGNKQGAAPNQLNNPSDVIIDKKTNSLLICDKDNRRVVRWARHNPHEHETLIEDIDCCGLAMNDNGFLYITDMKKHEVRRYKMKGKYSHRNYEIIAGGKGPGSANDQLNQPTYLFVDQQQTVYVSDTFNNRIMKWKKGAKQGVSVAGVGSRGVDKLSLTRPRALFVDSLENVYVVDLSNHRIVRWSTETDPMVIVGGKGSGNGADQLDKPMGLSVDRHGNLYVVDSSNHRIQRFSIKDQIQSLPRRKWKQDAQKLAGSHQPGNQLNELYHCCGIYVDTDGSIVIADSGNDRIVEWKPGQTSGEILAGGHGKGNASNQLHHPTDVIIDKARKNVFICDSKNRRVVRWARRDGRERNLSLEDIDCYGLALDNSGFLYVSDTKKHAIWCYKVDSNSFYGQRKIVVGGKGIGNAFNQLNHPTFIYVDQHHSIYVSDTNNNRVMKWVKNAKEGSVVAGSSSKGDDGTQLSKPSGLFVNSFGVIYVVDSEHHQVVRWYQGEGEVIAGGKQQGNGSNQLNFPEGLAVDRNENIYVADFMNNRVQRFSVIEN